MARAVTDSMAFQVYDVVAAMSAQSPAPLGALYVDGGPSRNDFLMQTVANVLGHPLIQRDAPEASALGAAYLAGLSLWGYGRTSTASRPFPRGNDIAPARPSRSRPLAIWRDAIARSTHPEIPYEW